MFRGGKEGEVGLCSVSALPLRCLDLTTSRHASYRRYMAPPYHQSILKLAPGYVSPQNGTVNASTVRGSYHLPNAVCRGGCLNVCLTLQNVASKGYVPQEYLKTCVIVSPKHVDYLKTCSPLYPECAANNFSKSPEYLTNSSPVSQNMW